MLNITEIIEKAQKTRTYRCDDCNGVGINPVRCSYCGGSVKKTPKGYITKAEDRRGIINFNDCQGGPRRMEKTRLSYQLNNS